MYTYKKAFKFSEEIKDIFKKHSINLITVGSIARKQSMIKDIDFITTHPLGDKKYVSFFYEKLKIDIWKVENLAYGKFIRSYPKHLLIAIHKKLKKNGYSLTPDGIIKISDNTIYPFNVKDVFKKADIEYRPITYYKDYFKK